jgi:hypothetical protein
MGGAAIAGPPPEDGEPPHERASRELTNPDEAKPAEGAPQGTDPGRSRAPKNLLEANQTDRRNRQESTRQK